jgi:hypothetical protein
MNRWCCGNTTRAGGYRARALHFAKFFVTINSTTNEFYRDFAFTGKPAR